MASSRPFQIPLRHSAINEKFASLGREIDRSDGAGSRTTVYNAYGEVTSERFPLATNSSAVISRTYDSLGRPKTILLGGVTAASYAYDAATGRYATVKNNSATVTYSYLDKTNLPLVQTWQKGTSSAFLTVSNTYDAYNRLTLINANSSNQAAYVYDSLGRRTSATLQDDTAWHYTYNQRSEITSAIRKNASNVTQNTMRYVFDNIGNRTSSYEDATSKTYDANCLNQYTEIDVTGGSSVCPLYDDDGNMTQFDSSTYTYDAENRLVGAQNGTTRLEFIYDALGRRVARKHYLNNTLSKHHRYVYDGMKLLATYNAKSSFAKINSFLWQPFGLDVPLIMSYNSTVYGYLVDANKNVLGLFNPSKTRVATYLYGPFGQKLSESGTIAANNPLQFSSEQFDTDLDLVYYNFRYYFPAIGKWLTKDPIGEEGGWNLYAFCGNDAINRWDSFGLFGLDDIKNFFRELHKSAFNGPGPGFGYFGGGAYAPDPIRTLKYQFSVWYKKEYDKIYNNDKTVKSNAWIRDLDPCPEHIETETTEKYYISSPPGPAIHKIEKEVVDGKEYWTLTPDSQIQLKMITAINVFMIATGI